LSELQLYVTPVRITSWFHNDKAIDLETKVIFVKVLCLEHKIMAW